MEVDDQIRVRFVTKTESLAVPDTALSLATACGRAQLGDVVNKLRGGSNLDLDFLWDEKLVQGSLAQHAARHGLSTENVAELEYFERRPEPEHTGSTTCGDDWVGMELAPSISRPLSRSSAPPRRSLSPSTATALSPPGSAPPTSWRP